MSFILRHFQLGVAQGSKVEEMSQVQSLIKKSWTFIIDDP